MRNTLTAVAMLAMIAGGAQADIYTDNTGNHLAGGDLHDFFQAQGFDHLDIASVEITNDATNLYVDITLNADLDATNWGKYAMGINNGIDSTDAGNGWGRNIDWNGQSISHWVASWADDGGSGIGGQVWAFDGSAWNETGGLAGADDSQHSSGHQQFVLALGDLGLSIGDTFTFDIVSTGGGNDPGVDHLSNAGFATDDWGVTSLAGDFLSYTVVPTPGAMSLLGIGGLVMTRRRR